jgi:hypothetical protein
MSGIHDLDRQYDGFKAATRMPQPAMRGNIAQGAATKDDLVTVVLEGEFDETLSFGPCRWMPYGSLFPEAGDPCILIFDGQMIPWVIGWWTDRPEPGLPEGDITVTGKLMFTDGNVYIWRVGSTLHAVGGVVIAEEGVDAVRASEFSSGFKVYKTGDSVPRMQLRADGLVEWGSGGAAFDANLYRESANNLQTDDTLNIRRFAVGDIALASFVDGDSVDRFQILANGTLGWGPGSGAIDTILYRAATKWIWADAVITSNMPSAGDAGLAVHVVGESHYRCLILADGTVVWGTGSAVGDTTLYRSGTNELKTDDRFVADSLETVGSVGLNKFGSDGLSFRKLKIVQITYNPPSTAAHAGNTNTLSAPSGTCFTGDWTALWGYPDQPNRGINFWTDATAPGTDQIKLNWFNADSTATDLGSIVFTFLVLNL